MGVSYGVVGDLVGAGAGQQLLWDDKGEREGVGPFGREDPGMGQAGVIDWLRQLQKAVGRFCSATCDGWCSREPVDVRSGNAYVLVSWSQDMMGMVSGDLKPRRAAKWLGIRTDERDINVVKDSVLEGGDGDSSLDCVHGGEGGHVLAVRTMGAIQDNIDLGPVLDCQVSHFVGH